MMQNLGSNPKISCSTVTDTVITNGFLYLDKSVFIVNSSPNPADSYCPYGQKTVIL